MGVGLLTTGQAQSQEYCVACTDPPAVYRCIIQDAKPGGSQPLQTFCVSAMIKQGRHGKCAIKGGTVFDCDGPVKRVPWSAQGEVPPPSAPEKRTSAPDPSKPPQTVEQMAQRAQDKAASDIKQTNEATRSLGDNIGDATKKTWRCVASFFTHCKD
jgi:hypothetical protein